MVTMTVGRVGRWTASDDSASSPAGVAEVETVPRSKARDRDADRPASPPPQRDAGEQAGGDVNGDLGRRQRLRSVVQLRAEEQRAQADGQQDRESVDGPFASGMATGQVGQGQSVGRRRRAYRRGPRPTRPGHDPP